MSTSDSEFGGWNGFNSIKYDTTKKKDKDFEDVDDFFKNTDSEFKNYSGSSSNSNISKKNEKTLKVDEKLFSLKNLDLSSESDDIIHDEVKINEENKTEEEKVKIISAPVAKRGKKTKFKDMSEEILSTCTSISTGESVDTQKNTDITNKETSIVKKSNDLISNIDKKHEKTVTIEKQKGIVNLSTDKRYIEEMKTKMPSREKIIRPEQTEKPKKEPPKSKTKVLKSRKSSLDVSLPFERKKSRKDKTYNKKNEYSDESNTNDDEENEKVTFQDSETASDSDFEMLEHMKKLSQDNAVQSEEVNEEGPKPRRKKYDFNKQYSDEDVVLCAGNNSSDHDDNLDLPIALRRTKRIRIKPIRRYLNERIEYTLDDSGMYSITNVIKADGTKISFNETPQKKNIFNKSDLIPSPYKEREIFIEPEESLKIDSCKYGRRFVHIFGIGTMTIGQRTYRLENNSNFFLDTFKECVLDCKSDTPLVVLEIGYDL